MIFGERELNGMKKEISKIYGIPKSKFKDRLCELALREIGMTS